MKSHLSIIIAVFLISQVSAQNSTNALFQCENGFFSIHQLDNIIDDSNLFSPTDYIGVKKILFSPAIDGELIFQLTPMYEYDDFDFMVECLGPKAIDQKVLIVNTNGPELSKYYNIHSVKTGIKSSESIIYTEGDISVKSLKVKADHIYLLTIANSTSESGFHIDFTNNQTLLKPIESLNTFVKDRISSNYSISRLGDCNTEISNKVKLYPSVLKSSEIISIESSEKNIKRIEILSIKGEMIKSFHPELKRANIACVDLLPGLYISRITLEDGSSSNKKFIIVE